MVSKFVLSTRALQLAGVPAAAATHLRSVPLAYVRAGDPPESSFDHIPSPSLLLPSALNQRYSDASRTLTRVHIRPSNDIVSSRRPRGLEQRLPPPTFLGEKGWAGPECHTNRLGHDINRRWRVFRMPRHPLLDVDLDDLLCDEAIRLHPMSQRVY